VHILQYDAHCVAFAQLEGKPVITSISELPRLREYKVQFNNLDGRLSPSLNDVSNTLYRFWISNNFISNSLPEAVFTRFSNFVQSLDLRNNSFLCGPAPQWNPRQSWVFRCDGGECGVFLEGTSLGQRCDEVLPEKPTFNTTCAPRWSQCGSANGSFSGPSECCNLDARCIAQPGGYSVCETVGNNVQLYPFECSITNQRCGGPDWQGPTTCCQSTDMCMNNGGNNSFCVPVNQTGAAQCVPMYGQCGGMQWNGLTKCCNSDAMCEGASVQIPLALCLK
jgi:hypothetical protein